MRVDSIFPEQWNPIGLGDFTGPTSDRGQSSSDRRNDSGAMEWSSTGARRSAKVQASSLGILRMLEPESWP